MHQENLQERVRRILASVDNFTSTNDSAFHSMASEYSALGEPALEVLLASVNDINSALLRREAPESNMGKLRARVVMLAKFRDERVVKPIMSALVDSSEAVLVLTAQCSDLQSQIEQTGNPFLGELLPLAEGRIDVAKRLKKECMGALVDLGEIALAHVERSIPKVPAHLQRPFFAVQARILKQWWKFWL